MIANIFETFLTDFNDIRMELLLKTNETENIEVTQPFWANQLDKQEIIIDGNYYDVKSIQYASNKIILKVVHDVFDLSFKKITENLNKKNKVVKTKKHIEILPNNTFQYTLNNVVFFLENNFLFLTIQENKIVIPFFHPPSVA